MLHVDHGPHMSPVFCLVKLGVFIITITFLRTTAVSVIFIINWGNNPKSDGGKSIWLNGFWVEVIFRRGSTIQGIKLSKLISNKKINHAQIPKYGRFRLPLFDRKAQRMTARAMGRAWHCGQVYLIITWEIFRLLYCIYLLIIAFVAVLSSSILISYHASDWSFDLTEMQTKWTQIHMKCNAMEVCYIYNTSTLRTTPRVFLIFFCFVLPPFIFL